MHIQVQAATPYVGTAAANTQVQVTITGQSGKKFLLSSLMMSFSAALPAAPVRATVSDGTTTLGLALTGLLDFEPICPIQFASGATVTITLPAGGGTAVGDVAAAGYFVPASEA
jgi:hypothetical protein